MRCCGRFHNALQTAQDGDGVFHPGLANQYFFGSGVRVLRLFDVWRYSSKVVAPMQLWFAACQSRFQHIARIHCAISFLPCADQSMDFIGENQGVAVVFRQVIQTAFQAFFKFAAVFRAGNPKPPSQNQQAFVREGFGHFAVNNTLRQAFNNSGFTHQAHQSHRVVLGAALQRLNRTADFIIGR